MRARGLKRKLAAELDLSVEVAPRAGAWIETKRVLSYTLSPTVAPRAGAWIETTLAIW